MEKVTKDFLEVNVPYPENLRDINLPFSSEIKKLDKVRQLVANLREKFKTSIKSWTSFEKNHKENIRTLNL